MACRYARHAPDRREQSAERLKGLLWAVTGRCNLSCGRCPMGETSTCRTELPLEDCLQLIEGFGQTGVRWVSLTGGEPLLRSDLLELLTALARKNIAVSEIFTNGLLITDDLLLDLRNLGLSPAFQVRFEAQEGHEELEARVLKGVEKLKAAGLPVALATTIDRDNRDTLWRTYKLVKDLKISAWRLSTLQALGERQDPSTGLSIEQEEYLYEPLLRRWAEDGKPFALRLGEIFAYPSADGQRHQAESLDCDSCPHTPYLRPDGVLLPCARYMDTGLQSRMPNALKDGLPKAGSDAGMRRLAELRKKTLLAVNEECGRCEFFSDCGGGCRASAVAQTGRILAKDPRACALARRGSRKRFAELAAR